MIGKTIRTGEPCPNYKRKMSIKKKRSKIMPHHKERAHGAMDMIGLTEELPPLAMKGIKEDVKLEDMELEPGQPFGWSPADSRRKALS